MKKFMMIMIYGSLIFTSSSLTFANNPIPKKTLQVGEYLTMGSIKNPLLLSLLKNSQTKNYRVLSKKTPQACKGLILDGEQITATKIIKSEEVKAAINQSIPIIISEPTKSEVNAITGFGIEGPKVMVIVPKKKGKEFELQLIGSNQDPHPKAMEKDRKSISAIVDDHYQLQTLKKDAKQDDEKPGVSHRRWTILANYVWGDEKRSSIRVGFQYDLFYLCNPKPARKYLYVKCIGTGLTSGKLKHDNRFHRGYYQDRVTVDIKGGPSNRWTGSRLRLEDYTPQSNNAVNQEQDTLGYQLWANGVIGISFGANSAVDNSALVAGVGIFTQHSITQQFNDFSVTFEPTSSSDQWTFWMNGAQGKNIRKEHPSRDVVSRKLGILCTIRELPQLANDAVLHPDVQALYYTHGDQQGNWTMTTTVGQYLRDVRSLGLFRKTKKKSHKIPQTVTIDFSQVNKCKDDKNKDG